MYLRAKYFLLPAVQMVPHCCPLPLDKPLETVLLFREDVKRCAVCGQPFLSDSNRAKYCKSCGAKVHRKQKNASDRKRRFICGQFEAKIP